ncbi:ribosome biogenesis protein BRX1 homolog [Mytilus californianus]|uniref:ribosome biogenesis protein BRX1 homolog n=1 Tax=Mytilus californianus TaxID=6549 RepID=UPI00224722DF|nr:ribosome biogenesis protein BRX1 homolog [Mytilus californianus]
MAKKKRTRADVEKEEKASQKENDVHLPTTISSDEPLPKLKKWINKERVLVFSSRGVSYRARHLMKDLRTLMPHSKAESKMDKKDQLFVVNEICEMKNCNKCIFFEAKKRKDLYMWIANAPRGPSAKFLVENVHTMLELKMTGNCLKGSRPLLSFDKNFDTEPHWNLLKELFTQIFSTPNYHPKSQPFYDNVYTFSIHDNRIWFRNYQILEEDGSLAEIGPRFVLNPIRMFSGSFGGPTLYQNPTYVSPNEYRRSLKQKVAMKYINKLNAKQSRKDRYLPDSYKMDPTDEVFVTIRPEDAKGADKNTFYRVT